MKLRLLPQCQTRSSPSADRDSLTTALLTRLTTAAWFGETRRTSKERGKGACKTRTTLNINQRLGGAPGGFIADEGKAFDPYDDGFGIMRDAQSAKPQTLRTGDGWFAYNLAVNLAQM